MIKEKAVEVVSHLLISMTIAVVLVAVPTADPLVIATAT